MNKAVTILFAASLFAGCSRSTPSVEVYNKDFNWTIVIPEGFDSVNTEDQAKMLDRGKTAIEDTYGEEIENKTKSIFLFRSGLTNYIEANQQPFDEAVDGDYLESRRALNTVLYETFADQIPGSKLDTATSIEKIDDLDFYKTEIVVTYPNAMVMNVLMYSRLFDNKDFSVNIMYTDEEKGKKMREAWLTSRFSNRQ
jgi:hypothetical protein